MRGHVGVYSVPRPSAWHLGHTHVGMGTSICAHLSARFHVTDCYKCNLGGGSMFTPSFLKVLPQTTKLPLKKNSHLSGALFCFFLATACYQTLKNICQCGRQKTR